MSTEQPATGVKWVDVLQNKARLAHQQIAALNRWVEDAGASKEMLEQLCAPYYATLESIYRDEAPLAYAIENSDLLLHVTGEAVETESPRLSLIASLFTSVRAQVGSVAYAIAGVLNKKSLPQEVDLGLSAFARGSLYLGFSMPPPDAEDKKGNRNLVGSEGPMDPLYQATRAAIKNIGIASRDLDSEDPQASLARSFPDPQLRDTILTAIHRIAPTGRKGIDSVAIGGRSVGDRRETVLTPALRKTINTMMEHPVQAIETAMFEGTLAEIDFDVRRFWLRRLEKSAIEDIRCIYRPEHEQVAEKCGNKRIRVTGTIERSVEGKPRLIEVSSMEPVLGAVAPFSDAQPRLLRQEMARDPLDAADLD